MEPRHADAVIVGGGLAGLATAVCLARAGRQVGVFERSEQLGGRAATQVEEGFYFNWGPHALYRHGHGAKLLTELGVPFTGQMPSVAGQYVVRHGVLQGFPDGLKALLQAKWLRWPAKLEMIRLMAKLPRIDPLPLQQVSLQAWLDRTIRHAEVRQFFRAMCRLTSYSDDPVRQSAGAALQQLQCAASGNVLYLDGGWQSLVEGLRQAALDRGVQLMTDARVVSILHDQTAHGIRLADGTEFAATDVVLAVGPGVASGLVNGSFAPALSSWAEAAVPIRAACLDVALSHLPQPQRRFALGLDEPLYVSVHSVAARLAPEGGAVIQVMRYLGDTTASDAKAVERELEQLLDTLQPGWRDVLVTRRFLPNMIVSHALVTAEQGGTAGRPGPVVPDIGHLYAVGDWVGPDGMLADASLASAQRAAELIVNRQDALAA